VTDPANHELNMVFTFEHVNLDIRPGGSKWDLAPLRLPVLKQNLAAWQEGWPASAGTRCTGTTTTSRGPSPGLVTTVRSTG
jgi:glycosidase